MVFLISYLQIFRLTTSRSRKFIRKQIWNEKRHISILNFCVESFSQYLKIKKMDYPLYFQKKIWPR